VLRGLGAAALLGAAGVARGAEEGVSSSELVIGQNITLQGGKNVYGAEAMAGIQACLQHANHNGGVGGRRVVLRTLDDENDSNKAEANARTLARQGVFVLFGSLEGGPSTAVMKAAVETGLPFIGPMAGSPGLRRPHQPLVFPVRAEHRDEFRALIDHGKRIGLGNVALLHADSAVGREHLGNVEKLAAAAGVAFGGGVPFKSDISDEQLAGVVATLESRRVDLLINHGSAGVYGRLIRTARGAGSRIAMWGVNSGSTPLAAQLGPLAHGMVFAQIVPNPNAGKTALVREYQERLAQGNPGMARSYGSLEGFMTAKALLAALRAAGTGPTRASLLAALQRFDADLGGVNLRWRRGEHTGSSFVDLALVGRDGRFVQ
jgi:ABC-type branched-subunit amino acid transport system substrate-binding protein